MSDRLEYKVVTTFWIVLGKTLGKIIDSWNYAKFDDTKGKLCFLGIIDS